jgi:hypothetical protein
MSTNTWYPAYHYERRWSKRTGRREHALLWPPQRKTSPKSTPVIWALSPTLETTLMLIPTRLAGRGGSFCRQIFWASVVVEYVLPPNVVVTLAPLVLLTPNSTAAEGAR